MPTHLTIPVQLLEYAVKQAIQPELKVFLGAKMVSPGYITDKSKEFTNLCDFTGLQRRTVLKHLDHLVRLKWVGYDQKAKRYYIRSWACLRSQDLFYERASVSFREKDMSTFREFVAGVLIGNKLSKQEYYFKKLAQEQDKYKVKSNKKLRKARLAEASKSVTNKGSVTPQDVDANQAIFSRLPGYNGLSNAHIADVLNCKYTNACNLKHDAEKAGYIRTNPKLRIIKALPRPDYSIRSQYRKAFGNDARKLRFSTELVNGVKTCCLLQQLHDEIIPLIPTRSVKYLKMLHKKQLKERRTNQTKFRSIIPS